MHATYFIRTHTITDEYRPTNWDYIYESQDLIKTRSLLFDGHKQQVFHH